MERKKGRSRIRTKQRDDREVSDIKETDLKRWMPMTAVILTAKDHGQERIVLV